MDVIDAIKNRRSVRIYTDQEIDKEEILKIIESAVYAPSGKNLQPWRFKILRDKNVITRISSLIDSGKWLQRANCIIAVYLDASKSYDVIKDNQSCGAAIQNMMLAAYSLGISSCWVGEITNCEHEANSILNVDNSNYKLCGLVSLGYSRGRVPFTRRNEIDSFLI